MKLSPERDALLSEHGKVTMSERYVFPGESYQEMFQRVATAYSDNEEHAQRMYDYISKLWFMGATPVMSNGGSTRGLPISCFLNDVEDSMDGIMSTWNENIQLAKNGGGIGTYWGKVRSDSAKVKGRGNSSGIMPFIRVQDSMTLAVSQGSLRRGAAAVYLPVDHPEIEEFISIRDPSGGDQNRKSLNLHNGICVTKEFMEAVQNDLDYELVDPKQGPTGKKLNARAVFLEILEKRKKTGEPYILFLDNIEAGQPAIHKQLGLKVKQSNLCTEIMLPTGIDHHGMDRTAVCCLGSINVEKMDEWYGNGQFVEDCLRFLDNVLEDFITRADKIPGFQKAVYAARRERSVGLGVMGFHSYLQSKMVPFESPMAKGVNLKLFKFLKENCDKANVAIAQEKGSCPDAVDAGMEQRFAHCMAIAPTASISVLAGSTSPGIEPWPDNIFNHKTLSGTCTVKNRYLKKLLDSMGKDTTDTWLSILEHGGSVQHLDFLTQDQKDVFKTTFEMDQRWLIEFAADRTPYIDQGQSLNLFIPADVHKRDLLMLHFMAWKKGIKSLYYCRSKSIRRTAMVGTEKMGNGSKAQPTAELNKYEECLACQ